MSHTATILVQIKDRAALEKACRRLKIEYSLNETVELFDGTKVTGMTRKLTGEFGREPSPAEIAGRMKLPADQVANLLMISRDTVSLEMPVGNDGNSELRDLIADDEAGTPMDSVIGEDLSKSVLRALETLNAREQRIIRMRFGIGEKESHTLAEIGREFGLSRERIRQLQALALRKLRTVHGDAALKQFVSG